MDIMKEKRNSGCYGGKLNNNYLCSSKRANEFDSKFLQVIIHTKILKHTFMPIEICPGVK